jgi:hypothetical protein
VAPTRFGGRACAAFIEATVAAFLLAATPLNAEPNKQDARCLEGVYTLEEFKRVQEKWRGL